MAKQKNKKFPTDIESHAIRIFLPLDTIDPEQGPQCCFNLFFSESSKNVSIGTSPVIPNDQTAALKSRYADTPLWEKVGNENKLPVSSDLAPQIRELASGIKPELISIWKQTSVAQRFLKTADLYETNVEEKLQKKKKLCLIFSEAAQSRLLQSGYKISQLTFDVKDLHVWLFSTGVSLASVQIHLNTPAEKALPAEALVEAVAAISKINTCKWVESNGFKDIPGPEFSFGALIQTLVRGSGVSYAPSKRAMTYTFARLHKYTPETDVEILSTYLARRYTAAYSFMQGQDNIKTIRSFTNVRHTVSTEGAASILVPNEDNTVPEFLKTWEKSVFLSAYSPIFLMALHEHLFLTGARHQSLLAHMHENAIDELGGMVDDVLMFRLFYRHSHVSNVSMHNAFSKGLREALSLESKLTELQEDVKAVSAKLKEALHEQETQEETEKHRKYYWISVWAGAFLAGLTSYTMAKEFFSLLWYPDKTTAGWTAVGIGAAIIVVSAIFGYLRGPKKPEKHHKSHLIGHAMVEHMIKRALHK